MTLLPGVSRGYWVACGALTYRTRSNEPCRYDLRTTLLQLLRQLQLMAAGGKLLLPASPPSLLAALCPCNSPSVRGAAQCRQCQGLRFCRDLGPDRHTLSCQGLLR